MEPTIYREFRRFTQPILVYSAHVTTDAKSPENPPKPLHPQEGLAVLHLFYRVDLTAWRGQSDTDRARALEELDALLLTARQRAQTQIVTLAMFARADLGFMIIAPDLHELNALEKKITASLGPDVLLPEFTYFSMTEKSEYTQKDDAYALELEKMRASRAAVPNRKRN